MYKNNLGRLQELTSTLERVESNLVEEKSILEFILESTTDGYWDWDIPKGYEYLSPKFKKQLGYEPDEMEDKPEAWQSICNTEDLTRSYEVMQSHFNGDTEEFREMLRFTHKEGYEIKILCRGKVIKRGVNGEPLRMIGTHTIIE
jgi:PAS domain S-box-containing protein